MLIVKDISIRNNINFNNLKCLNVDKHTILLEKEKEVLLIFKHAINGCEGIPFDQIDQVGDLKLSQTSHLTQWSIKKVPVFISINGKEIETTIWNGSNDFVIFLTRDKYINKQRIDYVRGPRLSI